MKFLRKLLNIPYWYLLAIPVLLFGTGIASNQAVLIANHGKFPVMVNQAMLEQMCSLPDDIDAEDVPAASCMVGGDMLDDVHSIMGPNSHLKALADIYLFRHDGIYSIGDFAIDLGENLQPIFGIAWLALVLRKFFEAEV